MLVHYVIQALALVYSDRSVEPGLLHAYVDLNVLFWSLVKRNWNDLPTFFPSESKIQMFTYLQQRDVWFQDKLIKKGMVILREKIKQETGKWTLDVFWAQTHCGKHHVAFGMDRINVRIVLTSTFLVDFYINYLCINGPERRQCTVTETWFRPV